MILFDLAEESGDRLKRLDMNGFYVQRRILRLIPKIARLKCSWVKRINGMTKNGINRRHSSSD